MLPAIVDLQIDTFWPVADYTECWRGFLCHEPAAHRGSDEALVCLHLHRTADIDDTVRMTGYAFTSGSCLLL